MDRLRSMEVFVAAVERGSFAAAARACRMTAPMVGKHIQQLEQRLGARLLARTTRRHRLTEIGQQYFERCKAILQQVGDAERGAEALRATPRGMLRIGAPVTFGSTRLAPALAEFLDRFPEIRIELLLSDELIELVDGAYDAAIRIGRLADSSLIARRLQPYRMLICATPAYLKRAGTPTTPADLAGHSCLGFTHWDSRGGWSLGYKRGKVTLPIPRFTANNGQALRNAALADAGIVMQPEALLADDVAAGRLVPVLSKFLRPARAMHLIYMRDRQAAPKIKAFVDFVIGRFGL
jgi:DNA-binding transcriptional LysR family regulator